MNIYKRHRFPPDIISYAGRLVPAPGRLERVAAEHAGERRVDRALGAADAVARVAGAQRRRGHERHRAPERGRPHRAHAPADIGGPGAQQRTHRLGEIVRGQRRMRVAARG